MPLVVTELCNALLAIRHQLQAFTLVFICTWMIISVQTNLVYGHSLNNIHSHEPFRLPDQGNADIQILRNRHTINIELLIPMWSLIGYPSLLGDDSVKNELDQQLALLMKPKGLWHFDDQSQCKPLEAVITAPSQANPNAQIDIPEKMNSGAITPLAFTDISKASLNTLSAPAREGGFLRARYTYRCVHMNKLKSLEVTLFHVFPGIYSADLRLEPGSWLDQSIQTKTLTLGANQVRFD